MNIISAVILGIVLFTVGGCATGAGVYHDRHTGETIVRADSIVASRGLFDSLWVTPYYSSRYGYGIFIEYRGTGTSKLYLAEAWSEGEKFQYKVADRRLASCRSDSGCIVTESGFIFLSQNRFNLASENGLEFKLIGKRGSVVGAVPVEAFRQVLLQIDPLESSGNAADEKLPAG
jgi:hypothetical protein